MIVMSYFKDFPFFAGIFVVFASLPSSAYWTVKNLLSEESWNKILSIIWIYYDIFGFLVFI